MPMTQAAHALEALVEVGEVSRGVPGTTLREATAYIAHGLRGGVPKTTAARALGISVPALDRWIAKGRIHVVQRPDSHRRAVDAVQLAHLVSEVRQLRRLGTNKRLLAAALSQMEVESDTALRRGVEAGLAAVKRGGVLEARIPEGFGPDD